MPSKPPLARTWTGPHLSMGWLMLLPYQSKGAACVLHDPRLVSVAFTAEARRPRAARGMLRQSRLGLAALFWEANNSSGAYTHRSTILDLQVEHSRGKSRGVGSGCLIPRFCGCYNNSTKPRALCIKEMGPWRMDIFVRTHAQNILGTTAQESSRRYCCKVVKREHTSFELEAGVHTFFPWGS